MEHLLQLLATARSAARRAGRAVLQYDAHVVAVRFKSGGAPVTEADIAAQQELIAMLAPTRIPILSEELPDDPARCAHERVWIIDPLDGTKDFLQGTGEYCVMIGLAERGRPVLGVVYQPAADAEYYAVAGGDPMLVRNGASPVRLGAARARASASGTIMLVSRNHRLPMDTALGKRLCIGAMVPGGSAGLKACKIAAGEADCYINSSDRTGEWDACAAECIVRAAGGTMTDMGGNDLRYNKASPTNPNGFVVATTTMHRRIITELRAMAVHRTP